MGVLLSCGTPFSFVSFPAFYSVIDASYSKGLQWGFCRGNIPLVTNALVNKIDFAKEWQELKIKLDVPKDLHLQLYQKLTEAGFEISDDASLVLTESMESTEYVSCKKMGIPTTFLWTALFLLKAWDMTFLSTQKTRTSNHPTGSGSWKSPSALMYSCGSAIP